jgi:osmotically-inducible protein OsmY
MRCALISQRPTATFASVMAIALVSIAGCTDIFLSDTASSVVVADDPGNTGILIEDQAIEIKALKLIGDNSQLRLETEANVTCYNQIVLLTGQASSAEFRDRLVNLVKRIEKVRHVHDDITIASPGSIASQTNDSYLTTKVKTSLLGEHALNATRIKVVTETGAVYLMGLLPREQGSLAAGLASQTAGVERVIKLFEYQ